MIFSYCLYFFFLFHLWQWQYCLPSPRRHAIDHDSHSSGLTADRAYQSRDFEEEDTGLSWRSDMETGTKKKAPAALQAPTSTVDCTYLRQKKLWTNLVAHGLWKACGALQRTDRGGEKEGNKPGIAVQAVLGGLVWQAQAAHGAWQASGGFYWWSLALHLEGLNAQIKRLESFMAEPNWCISYKVVCQCSGTTGRIPYSVDTENKFKVSSYLFFFRPTTEAVLSDKSCAVIWRFSRKIFVLHDTRYF